MHLIYKMDMILQYYPLVKLSLVFNKIQARAHPLKKRIKFLKAIPRIIFLYSTKMPMVMSPYIRVVHHQQREVRIRMLKWQLEVIKCQQTFWSTLQLCKLNNSKDSSSSNSNHFNKTTKESLPFLTSLDPRSFRSPSRYEFFLLSIQFTKKYRFVNIKFHTKII